MRTWNSNAFRICRANRLTDEMEKHVLDPQEVEDAKAFWAEEDVDRVFDRVYDYLDHLKRVLKKNTATDKEFVQGLKLIEVLTSPVETEDSSVVQVVIGSDELLPSESLPPSPVSSVGPPPEELLPPLAPLLLQYKPHACSKSCMPSLPSMPQCTPAFWGQNPLKVPLLCGFKRLSAVMMSSGAEPEEDVEPDKGAGQLFTSCCDCPDGCSDASRCACVAMTTGGQGYSHHRLAEPVQSGVFECGPWCGCVRGLCQNRPVQQGLRVRLQVFRVGGQGWGVRCRDDVDTGTFICIYAGMMLRRVQSDPSPPKLTRLDLPSDDEVELVTEWLPPPVLEVRSTVLETPQQTPTSPPPHVPVIQRPPPDSSSPPTGQKVSVAPPPASGDPDGGVIKSQKKRALHPEDVYFLDASKEGNVARFINHSCDPNLFVQNVFTDTHDPGFPVIAFFTSRVVKAGSELTWDYSAGAESSPGVVCLCSSEACRGRSTVKDQLCDSR
ncbi:hypothetical protein PBY51_016536 [Eleginops maclovinus]|uniref:Histone-lysine N-methyltransferase SETDB2 n=1 Tax=Eleginops maclovinus TaxID=56733 RepID=A0AAN7ZZA8_ELEMC|nr:hypothetical protein PBY51_016536 [Eleginops maclovinus]